MKYYERLHFFLIIPSNLNRDVVRIKINYTF